MSFEEVELAFWKHKILEREKANVEWARHVIRSTELGNKLDPDAPVPNPWLDEDFEVVDVSFRKGDGEYRLSEYTSDYDYDIYNIRLKFSTDGRSVTYPYTLFEHENILVA